MYPLYEASDGCSNPGIAACPLETDLNTAIIPFLENITRTVNRTDESRSLALKHEEEKKECSLKHKKKIDESERVLHEHKRVRTVAQLKILEPIGTGLLADILECPACLLPMLPPVKIFSCEREGSPHLRDVQAAGDSKHLRSLQESRPRG